MLSYIIVKDKIFLCFIFIDVNIVYRGWIYCKLDLIYMVTYSKYGFWKSISTVNQHIVLFPKPLKNS